jgi:hypothetical protein
VKAQIAPFDPQFLDSKGNLFGSGIGRSKGTHLSSVIKYIRIKLGELRLTGNDAFAMFGFIFEILVEKALAAYLTFNEKDMIEPGEQECDGIFLTPDRFNPFIGENGTVFEYKATWKSIGGSKTKASIFIDGVRENGLDVEVFQERFWYWLMQLMEYCRALGTYRGCIVALFMNGDYSFRDPYGGPQFVCVEFEFTEEEIEANHEMVVREAREMEREDAA